MSVLSISTLRIGSLQLRGKILFLYAISTLFLLTAAGAGFWQFNATEQVYESVSVSQDNAVNVVVLESTFKKQVQEWKDVLLRKKNRRLEQTLEQFRTTRKRCSQQRRTAS